MDADLTGPCGNPQQFASEDSLRTIPSAPRIPKDRVESLKIAWQRQLQHELVLRGNVAGDVAILTNVGGPLRGEAPDGDPSSGASRFALTPKAC